MPRHARLQASGLPMHIIQRGNNRQACFFAEEGYRFFLDHLAQLEGESAQCPVPSAQATYPGLKIEDIRAAVAYAADTLAHEETILLPPRKEAA